MYYRNIKDYEKLVNSTTEDFDIDIYATLLTFRKGLACTVMLAHRTLLSVVKVFRV